MLRGYIGHKNKMPRNIEVVEINLNSSIQIKSSAETIFEVVSNHVGTPNWVEKVKHVSLLKDGKTVNGLGTIRKVVFKPLFWTTVEEEVVSYTENEHFHYKVISKMPGLIEHLGKWEVVPMENDIVEVHWKVYFKFKKKHWFKFFMNSFSESFKSVQEEALAKLKEQLAKA